jgi:hypothetical protein
MEQVDGPSLADYDGQPSIFVGKSVPIKLRTTLEVPINVTAPGSIVEYSIETQSYDIIFGIAAEREEGITVVKVCYISMGGFYCGLATFCNAHSHAFSCHHHLYTGTSSRRFSP